MCIHKALHIKYSVSKRMIKKILLKILQKQSYLNRTETYWSGLCCILFKANDNCTKNDWQIKAAIGYMMSL